MVANATANASRLPIVLEETSSSSSSSSHSSSAHGAVVVVVAFARVKTFFIIPLFFCTRTGDECVSTALDASVVVGLILFFFFFSWMRVGVRSSRVTEFVSKSSLNKRPSRPKSSESNDAVSLPKRFGRRREKNSCRSKQRRLCSRRRLQTGFGVRRKM